MFGSVSRCALRIHRRRALAVGLHCCFPRRGILTTTATVVDADADVEVGSARDIVSVIHSRTRSVAPLRPDTVTVRAHMQQEMVKLVRQIGSRKEVAQYLKLFASAPCDHFAVIKVGGGLIRDEIDTLSESLAFLHNVGLTPIIIHGAGPQLNSELKAMGIESDYVNGLRITTPEILSTARRVFQRENLRLVDALEARGTRARPITSGVFEADFLDRGKLQLVGQVQRVHVASIRSALDSGHLPVLTCMGETARGQVLNINADVAARELARELQPIKVIYLSQVGGLRDQKDDLIRCIDLDEDYERLMHSEWFRHGNRLKLKQIKELMDVLPASSSVAITSAGNLPKELFSHRGGGTLISRGVKIDVHESFDSIDKSALKQMIEESFGGLLKPGYFESIESQLFRVYVSHDYRAAAIVTKQGTGKDCVPYLDKFAVAKAFQSEGVGNHLWETLRADIPQLAWRSRVNNAINPWYFQRADGSWMNAKKGWTVFWYGLPESQTLDGVQHVIETVLANPTSIVYESHETDGDGEVVTDGLPNDENGEKKKKKKKRIGLIGARGYTGAELVQLIDGHPSLTLSVVSSRSMQGKCLADAVPSLPEESPIRSLQFSQLAPDNLDSWRAYRDDVDLWVLALPNGLASQHVAAIEATQQPSVKIIDLSADMRFDESGEWAYGLPESSGGTQRDVISSVLRVANPGCYATGGQLAVYPLLPRHYAHNRAPVATLQTGSTPTIFGVSGYSGAGTSPSRKNSVAALNNNMMPYALCDHIHEREMSAHTGVNVRFMPHVGAWFRGISLTVALELNKPIANVAAVRDQYVEFYRHDRLVTVLPLEDIPEVVDSAGHHGVRIGGFTTSLAHPNRLVVVACLDNLLKGAATQCIQNINLMLGVPEYAGIINE